MVNVPFPILFISASVATSAGFGVADATVKFKALNGFVQGAASGAKAKMGF